MSVRMIAITGVAVGLLAGPALGHHSFARFDPDTTVEAQGTIKEFQWTNPHSWIEVMVTDAEGQEVQWSLELGGPGGLSRDGWTPRTIVPGDEVTVRFHPRRDGAPIGQFLSIVLPNGEFLED